MAMSVLKQNLYDQFAPPERLTLYLEAMAREDWREAGVLRSSCPRRTYSCLDLAFADRQEMAGDVTSLVCIDLQTRKARPLPQEAIAKLSQWKYRGA